MEGHTGRRCLRRPPRLRRRGLLPAGALLYRLLPHRCHRHRSCGLAPSVDEVINRTSTENEGERGGKERQHGRSLSLSPPSWLSTNTKKKRFSSLLLVLYCSFSFLFRTWTSDQLPPRPTHLSLFFFALLGLLIKVFVSLAFSVCFDSFDTPMLLKKVGYTTPSLSLYEW